MTQAEAQAIVECRFASSVGTERTALAAALNRVLAADLVATVDLPPYNSAAVDGVAVRAADLRTVTTMHHTDFPDIIDRPNCVVLDERARWEGRTKNPYFPFIATVRRH